MQHRSTAERHWRDSEDVVPRITGEVSARNPLVELAQQFGEASGMGRGLRSALELTPRSGRHAHPCQRPAFPRLDPRRGGVRCIFLHVSARLRGSVSDLPRRRRPARSGGASGIARQLAGRDCIEDGQPNSSSFARARSTTARRSTSPSAISCGRLSRSAPILKPDDDRGLRQMLMQAFRARGIYPESASFFSEDALALDACTRLDNQAGARCAAARRRDSRPIRQRASARKSNSSSAARAD